MFSLCLKSHKITEEEWGPRTCDTHAWYTHRYSAMFQHDTWSGATKMSKAHDTAL